MPRLLALFENIIPDWKWLKVTNSFAKHETELIRAIKIFIVQAHGAILQVLVKIFQGSNLFKHLVFFLIFSVGN